MFQVGTPMESAKVNAFVDCRQRSIGARREKFLTLLTFRFAVGLKSRRDHCSVIAIRRGALLPALRVHP